MDTESDYSEDDIDDGNDFELQDNAYEQQPHQAKSPKAPITREEFLRGDDPQGIPWSELGTS